MKLNKEQLIELFEIVKQQLIEHKMLRLGQSFFNNLVDLYPQFDKEIRGTIYDCFHTNSNIVAVIKLICEDEAIEWFKTTNLYIEMLRKILEDYNDLLEKKLAIQRSYDAFILKFGDIAI